MGPGSLWSFRNTSAGLEGPLYGACRDSLIVVAVCVKFIARRLIPMPPESTSQSTLFRRLIRWLLAGLVLIEALHWWAADRLRETAGDWMEQRGLEFSVGHLRVSLLDLSVIGVNVKAENRQGRGFSARELVLDYSWWQLLRGRVQLPKVALTGVYMDLQSSPGERSRLWELGGWNLGEGQRRDRNFHLTISRAQVRDSELCYRHRPIWTEATCVSIGKLYADSFRLALRRTGDTPLHVDIAAAELEASDLLAWERGHSGYSTVLGRLHGNQVHFAWPGLATTLHSVAAEYFSGCPPQRWAEVVKGLQRLVGHCASARRLAAEGDIHFGFGRKARVQWRQLNGENVVLRRSERRWQDWRAGVIRIHDFNFERPKKRLQWQRGFARAFDWCPRHLRNANSHLCLRAANLDLPERTVFDWSQHLNIQSGSSAINRGYLLDMAQPTRHPIRANNGVFGPLQFSAITRTLSFAHLGIETASGCVPGGLWHKPDHCIAMRGLKSTESFAFRFGSSARDIAWGLSSGPLQLAQFSIGARGQPRAELQALRWRSLDTIGNSGPLSAQDFFIQSLSGCVPRDFLPPDWQPLCAHLNRFAGRGQFAWQGGEDGYAILGELALHRLLLNDSVDAGGGLLLQQFESGNSFYKKRVADNPWLVSAPLPGMPGGINRNSGTREKGRLQRRDSTAEKNSSDLALASIENPNLKINSLALRQLGGCLTESWTRLFYRTSQNDKARAVCFELQSLQQKKPLLFSWQQGIDFSAKAFSVARAEAKTRDNKSLINLSGIELPLARIRHRGTGEFESYAALPGATAERVNSCGPTGREISSLKIHCVNLENLSLGDYFYTYLSPRYLFANLDNSAIKSVRLQGVSAQDLLDIGGVSIAKLELQWFRDKPTRSKIVLQDIAAGTLKLCLPQQAGGHQSMPACVFGRNLHSLGQSGWSIEAVEFKGGGEAAPILQLGRVFTERMSFSANTLDLYGLNINNILFCGLKSFSSENSAEISLADCIETPLISFSDSWVKLGLVADVPRVSLGPLKSEPIAFWQKAGNYLQAGVQSLGWSRFTWNSGAAFSLADLTLQNIRVCTRDTELAVTVAKLKRIRAGDSYHCFGVDKLSMPGLQKIKLSSPWSVQSSVALAGVSIPRKKLGPLKIPKFEIDNISLRGESLAQATGARGCMPRGILKDDKIAPCYELGEFSIGGAQAIHGAAGRQLILSGIKVSNIQLHEQNFPQDLPLKLLSVSAVGAGHLRISREAVDFKELEFKEIGGCFPSGYLDQGDHCFRFSRLLLEGNFHRGRGAELATLQLNDITLLSPSGEELVQGESISLSRLLFTDTEWRLAAGEATHFHFFERHPDSLEFDRHRWMLDFESLRLEDLRYHRPKKTLNIGFIDFLRPRVILLRDLSGNLPMLRKIHELRGFTGIDTITLKEEGAPALLYHLGDLYLKHGTFTWVDHREEFRARLPIRDINFNLSDLSNLAKHPPAVIVVNGRPGGFGEVQIGGTVDYLGNKKWNAELTGYLTSVNLIPAAPYMAKLLGYKILQGQGDAVVNIQVFENQLKGFSDIRLEKLKVRRVRKGDPLPVKSTLIPLNLALWLLKDGQGNIKFAMPVSGNIRDPKFSFSFVFSELLQKSIIDALMSYFTPYGVYLLARYAWGRFRATSFPAIDFEPGSAKLTGLALAQLQRMVVVLSKNPDTRPGICGIANARDWQALYPYSTAGIHWGRGDFYRNPPLGLREELESLAKARSRAVERYLIDAGIKASELIPCAPDYLGREFGRPRVEFSN
ncbi:DUF748 domain-containing protein [Microbulbifer sp. SSSA002]|uniref:DUF748 domain-containing protein n=1 Tax=Microbulbifer sp. SSSA002 TaxID=3243376 RepID=UPI0040397125